MKVNGLKKVFLIMALVLMGMVSITAVFSATKKIVGVPSSARITEDNLTLGTNATAYLNSIRSGSDYTGATNSTSIADIVNGATSNIVIKASSVTSEFATINATNANKIFLEGKDSNNATINFSSTTLKKGSFYLLETNMVSSANQSANSIINVDYGSTFVNVGNIKRGSGDSSTGEILNIYGMFENYGDITGDIIVNNDGTNRGSLSIYDGVINGNIRLMAGASLSIEGGTINGDIIAEEKSSWVSIEGATVNGTITIGNDNSSGNVSRLDIMKSSEDVYIKNVILNDNVEMVFRSGSIGDLTINDTATGGVRSTVKIYSNANINKLNAKNSASCITILSGTITTAILGGADLNISGEISSLSLYNCDNVAIKSGETAIVNATNITNGITVSGDAKLFVNCNTNTTITSQDTAQITINANGSVKDLVCEDTSTLKVLGIVSNQITLSGTVSVDLSGGSVNKITANTGDASTVNVASGAEVGKIELTDTSTKLNVDGDNYSTIIDEIVIVNTKNLSLANESQYLYQINRGIIHRISLSGKSAKVNMTGGKLNFLNSNIYKQYSYVLQLNNEARFVLNSTDYSTDFDYGDLWNYKYNIFGPIFVGEGCTFYLNDGLVDYARIMYYTSNLVAALSIDSVIDNKGSVLINGGIIKFSGITNGLGIHQDELNMVADADTLDNYVDNYEIEDNFNTYIINNRIATAGTTNKLSISGGSIYSGYEYTGSKDDFGTVTAINNMSGTARIQQDALIGLNSEDGSIKADGVKNSDTLEILGGTIYGKNCAVNNTETATIKNSAKVIAEHGYAIMNSGVLSISGNVIVNEEGSSSNGVNNTGKLLIEGSTKFYAGETAVLSSCTTYIINGEFYGDIQNSSTLYVDGTTNYVPSGVFANYGSNKGKIIIYGSLVADNQSETTISGDANNYAVIYNDNSNEYGIKAEGIINIEGYLVVGSKKATGSATEQYANAKAVYVSEDAKVAADENTIIKLYSNNEAVINDGLLYLDVLSSDQCEIYSSSKSAIVNNGSFSGNVNIKGNGSADLYAIENKGSLILSGIISNTSYAILSGSAENNTDASLKNLTVTGGNSGYLFNNNVLNAKAQTISMNNVVMTDANMSVKLGKNDECTITDCKLSVNSGYAVVNNGSLKIVATSNMKITSADSTAINNLGDLSINGTLSFDLTVQQNSTTAIVLESGFGGTGKLKISGSSYYLNTNRAIVENKTNSRLTNIVSNDEGNEILFADEIGLSGIANMYLTGKYVVSFSSNFHSSNIVFTSSSLGSITCYSGQEITLPKPVSQTDYIFNGWLDGDTLYTDKYIVNKSIEFVLSETRVGFSVSKDNEDAVTYYGGETLTLSAPTSDSLGKTFASWLVLDKDENEYTIPASGVVKFTYVNTVYKVVYGSTEIILNDANVVFTSQWNEKENQECTLVVDTDLDGYLDSGEEYFNISFEEAKTYLSNQTSGAYLLIFNTNMTEMTWALNYNKLDQLTIAGRDLSSSGEPTITLSNTSSTYSSILNVSGMKALYVRDIIISYSYNRYAITSMNISGSINFTNTIINAPKGVGIYNTMGIININSLEINSLSHCIWNYDIVNIGKKNGATGNVNLNCNNDSGMIYSGIYNDEGTLVVYPNVNLNIVSKSYGITNQNDGSITLTGKYKLGKYSIVINGFGLGISNISGTMDIANVEIISENGNGVEMCADVTISGDVKITSAVADFELDTGIVGSSVVYPKINLKSTTLLNTLKLAAENYGTNHVLEASKDIYTSIKNKIVSVSENNRIASAVEGDICYFYTISSYVLLLNENNGTDTVLKHYGVIDGESFDFAKSEIPKYNGYEFLGYSEQELSPLASNADASVSLVFNSQGKMVSSSGLSYGANTNLYAVWRCIDFTIRFQNTDTNKSTTMTISGANGGTISETVTKLGYIFEGWKITETNTNIYINNSVATAGTILSETLEAGTTFAVIAGQILYVEPMFTARASTDSDVEVSISFEKDASGNPILVYATMLDVFNGIADIVSSSSNEIVITLLKTDPRSINNLTAYTLQNNNGLNIILQSTTGNQYNICLDKLIVKSNVSLENVRLQLSLQNSNTGIEVGDDATLLFSENATIYCGASSSTPIIIGNNSKIIVKGQGGCRIETAANATNAVIDLYSGTKVNNVTLGANNTLNLYEGFTFAQSNNYTFGAGTVVNIYGGTLPCSSINLASGAVLNMYSGTIASTKGITVSGTLNMYSGTLTFVSSYATTNSYIKVYGLFNMEGGELCGSTKASYGVFVYAGGTATINGDIAINKNDAPATHGIANYGTVNLGGNVSIGSKSAGFPIVIKTKTKVNVVAKLTGEAIKVRTDYTKGTDYDSATATVSYASGVSHRDTDFEVESQFVPYYKTVDGLEGMYVRTKYTITISVPYQVKFNDTRYVDSYAFYAGKSVNGDSTIGEYLPKARNQTGNLYSITVGYQLETDDEGFPWYSHYTSTGYNLNKIAVTESRVAYLHVIGKEFDLILYTQGGTGKITDANNIGYPISATTESITLTARLGESIVLDTSEFVKENYNLLGWNTYLASYSVLFDNADGQSTITVGEMGLISSGSFDLYAIWAGQERTLKFYIPADSEYTMTDNSTNGSLTITTETVDGVSYQCGTVTAVYGMPYSNYAPSVSTTLNKKFDGWYTTATLGTGKKLDIYTSKVGVNDDGILSHYGLWKDGAPYKFMLFDETGYNNGNYTVNNAVSKSDNIASVIAGVTASKTYYLVVETCNISSTSVVFKGVSGSVVHVVPYSDEATLTLFAFNVEKCEYIFHKGVNIITTSTTNGTYNMIMYKATFQNDMQFAFNGLYVNASGIKLTLTETATINAKNIGLNNNGGVIEINGATIKVADGTSVLAQGIMNRGTFTMNSGAIYGINCTTLIKTASAASVVNINGGILANKTQGAGKSIINNATAASTVNITGTAKLGFELDTDNDGTIDIATDKTSYIINNAIAGTKINISGNAEIYGLYSVYSTVKTVLTMTGGTVNNFYITTGTGTITGGTINNVFDTSVGCVYTISGTTFKNTLKYTQAKCTLGDYVTINYNTTSSSPTTANCAVSVDNGDFTTGANFVVNSNAYGIVVNTSAECTISPDGTITATLNAIYAFADVTISNGVYISTDDYSLNFTGNATMTGGGLGSSGAYTNAGAYVLNESGRTFTMSGTATIFANKLAIYIGVSSSNTSIYGQVDLNGGSIYSNCLDSTYPYAIYNLGVLNIESKDNKATITTNGSAIYNGNVLNISSVKIDGTDLTDNDNGLIVVNSNVDNGTFISSGEGVDISYNSNKNYVIQVLLGTITIEGANINNLSSYKGISLSKNTTLNLKYSTVNGGIDNNGTSVIISSTITGDSYAVYNYASAYLYITCSEIYINSTNSNAYAMYNYGYMIIGAEDGLIYAEDGGIKIGSSEKRVSNGIYNNSIINSDLGSASINAIYSNNYGMYTAAKSRVDTTFNIDANGIALYVDDPMYVEDSTLTSNKNYALYIAKGEVTSRNFTLNGYNGMYVAQGAIYQSGKITALTSNIAVDNYGTITNGTFKIGTDSNRSAKGILNRTTGKSKLSADIYASDVGIQNLGAGQIEIKGGSINCSNGYAFENENKSGVATISGSLTINSSSTTLAEIRSEGSLIVSSTGDLVNSSKTVRIFEDNGAYLDVRKTLTVEVSRGVKTSGSTYYDGKPIVVAGDHTGVSLANITTSNDRPILQGTHKNSSGDTLDALYLGVVLTININNTNSDYRNEVIQPVEVYFGQKVSLETLADRLSNLGAFIFKGLYDAETGGNQIFDEKGKLLKGTIEFTEDTTLYAQWGGTITYNIAFDGNGDNGEYTEPTKTNISFGQEVELPYPGFVKLGYHFKSWCTTADGTGTIYQYETKVKNLTTTANSTVVLYAVWEKNTMDPDENGDVWGNVWYEYDADGDGEIDDTLFVYYDEAINHSKNVNRAIIYLTESVLQDEITIDSPNLIIDSYRGNNANAKYDLTFFTSKNSCAIKVNASKSLTLKNINLVGIKNDLAFDVEGTLILGDELDKSVYTSISTTTNKLKKGINVSGTLIIYNATLHVDSTSNNYLVNVEEGAECEIYGLTATSNRGGIKNRGSLILGKEDWAPVSVSISGELSAGDFEYGINVYNYTGSTVSIYGDTTLDNTQTNSITLWNLGVANVYGGVLYGEVANYNALTIQNAEVKEIKTMSTIARLSIGGTAKIETIDLNGSDAINILSNITNAGDFKIGISQLFSLFDIVKIATPASGVIIDESKFNCMQTDGKFVVINNELYMLRGSKLTINTHKELFGGEKDTITYNNDEIIYRTYTIYGTTIQGTTINLDASTYAYSNGKNVLLGWDSNESVTTPEFLVGKSFVLTNNQYTLHAIYKQGSVKLNVNNGSLTDSNWTTDENGFGSATTAIGGFVTLPTADYITRIGYTFSGWKEGSTTYNGGANYQLTAETNTLEAIWTVNEQTSSSDFSYQTVSVDSSNNTVYGDKLYLTTAELISVMHSATTNANIELLTSISSAITWDCNNNVVFTFSGVNAEGTNYTLGGVLNISGSASYIFNNVDFKLSRLNAISSGKINITENATVKINNSNITSSHSDLSTSGLISVGGKSLVIKDSNFTFSNNAVKGLGIVLASGDLELSNVVFNYTTTSTFTEISVSTGNYVSINNVYRVDNSVNKGIKIEATNANSITIKGENTWISSMTITNSLFTFEGGKVNTITIQDGDNTKIHTISNNGIDEIVVNGTPLFMFTKNYSTKFTVNTITTYMNSSLALVEYNNDVKVTDETVNSNITINYNGDTNYGLYRKDSSSKVYYINNAFTLNLYLSSSLETILVENAKFVVGATYNLPDGTSSQDVLYPYIISDRFEFANWSNGTDVIALQGTTGSDRFNGASNLYACWNYIAPETIGEVITKKFDGKAKTTTITDPTQNAFLSYNYSWSKLGNNMFNVNDSFDDVERYDSSTGYLGHLIQLKPNTTYTISVSGNNNSTVIFATVGNSYNKAGSKETLLAHNNYSASGAEDVRLSATKAVNITTTSNGKLWINVLSSSKELFVSRLKECLSSIQIEEGSTVSSFAEYTETSVSNTTKTISFTDVQDNGVYKVQLTPKYFGITGNAFNYQYEFVTITRNSPVITASNTVATWDGNTHTFDVDITNPPTSYTLSYIVDGGEETNEKPSFTSAGEYEVKIKLTSTDKNFDDATTTIKYVVNKADLGDSTISWNINTISWTAVQYSTDYTITFKTPNNRIYTIDNGTELSWEIGRRCDGSGIYTVTLEITGDSNHNDKEITITTQVYELSLSADTDNAGTLQYSTDTTDQKTWEEYYVGNTYVYMPTGTVYYINLVANVGYNFSGWNNDGDSSKTIRGPFTLTGDATYTANFNKIEYTITLDARKGTFVNGTASTYTYMIGESVEIPAMNKLYRSSCMFGGWLVHSLDGTASINGKNLSVGDLIEVSYSSQTSVTLDEGSAANITLYAAWQLIVDVNLIDESTGNQLSNWGLIKTYDGTTSVVLVDESNIPEGVTLTYSVDDYDEDIENTYRPTMTNNKFSFTNVKDSGYWKINWTATVDYDLAQIYSVNTLSGHKGLKVTIRATDIVYTVENISVATYDATTHEANLTITTPNVDWTSVSQDDGFYIEVVKSEGCDVVITLTQTGYKVEATNYQENSTITFTIHAGDNYNVATATMTINIGSATLPDPSNLTWVEGEGKASWSKIEVDGVDVSFEVNLYKYDAETSTWNTVSTVSCTENYYTFDFNAEGINNGKYKFAVKAKSNVSAYKDSALVECQNTIDVAKLEISSEQVVGINYANTYLGETASNAITYIIQGKTATIHLEGKKGYTLTSPYWTSSSTNLVINSSADGGKNTAIKFNGGETGVITLTPVAPKLDVPEVLLTSAKTDIIYGTSDEFSVTSTVNYSAEQVQAEYTWYKGEEKITSGDAGFTITDGVLKISSTAYIGTNNISLEVKISDGTNTASTRSSALALTINPADILVKPVLTTAEYTYTGSNINAVVSIDSATSKFIEVAEGSATGATDVGAYTITYKIKDSYVGAYRWVDGTQDKVILSWKIIPKKLTKTTLKTTEFVYKNTAIKIATSNVENFDSALMTLTYEAQINVGNYTASVSLKDKKNYTWLDGSTEDVIMEWSIIKADLINATENVEVVYDGLAHTLDVKVEDVQGYLFDASDIKVTYSSSQNGEYTTTNIFATNVADTIAPLTVYYKVEVVADEYKNNYNILSGSNTIKITTRTITFTWDTTEFVYNLEKQDPTPLWTDEVLTSIDELTFSYEYKDADGNWKEQLADTISVGTYRKTILSKPNFEFVNNVVEYTIGLRKVSVPSFDSLELTYNGNVQTITFNAVDGYNSNYITSMFTFNGENVDVTINASSWTISVQNAGSGTIKFALKDKSNFRWADDNTNLDKSFTIVVKKKEAEVKWTNTSVVYNGKVQLPVASIVGYTDTLVLDTEGYINAGTYKVTATNVNFVLTNNTVNFVIAPKGIDVPILANSEFTYDGTLKTVSVIESSYDKTLVTLSNDMSATDAGDYTLIATLKDSTNYCWNVDKTNAPKSLSWSIKKADVKISTSVSSITMNVGENATAQVIVEFVGNLDSSAELSVVDADNAKYNINISSPVVEDGKAYYTITFNALDVMNGSVLFHFSGDNNHNENDIGIGLIINSITLTLLDDGNGSVSCGTTSVVVGQTVEIKLAPNKNYGFFYATISNRGVNYYLTSAGKNIKYRYTSISQECSLLYTVTSDDIVSGAITITAHFSQIATVNIKLVNSAGVDMTGYASIEVLKVEGGAVDMAFTKLSDTAIQIYSSATTMTYSAVANKIDGFVYGFKSVKGNSTNFVSGINTIDISANATITFVVEKMYKAPTGIDSTGKYVNSNDNYSYTVSVKSADKVVESDGEYYIFDQSDIDITIGDKTGKYTFVGFADSDDNMLYYYDDTKTFKKYTDNGNVIYSTKYSGDTADMNPVFVENWERTNGQPVTVSASGNITMTLVHSTGLKYTLSSDKIVSDKNLNLLVGSYTLKINGTQDKNIFVYINGVKQTVSNGVCSFTVSNNDQLSISISSLL